MLKRLFDLILSALLLLVLSPLFLVVYLIVRIKIGKPTLFAQKRPGLKEKIFTVYKFRTMTDEKDSAGELLPDHCRLTTIGKYIRTMSLDELPQLWNVFKGEMSFVGPRPLLVEYLPLYDATQKKRHDVRPGITGWAQVNGRNALSWEEKFKLDVWYVDHQSFWLDIKILILTFKKVLKREHASVTAERFLGS